MKRRLRSLLTLTLTLCLGLTMTTGTALASDMQVKDIEVGHSFQAGDKINYGVNQGITICYYQAGGVNLYDSPGMNLILTRR